MKPYLFNILILFSLNLFGNIDSISIAKYKTVVFNAILNNDNSQAEKYIFKIDSILQKTDDLEKWLSLYSDLGKYYRENSKPFTSLKWYKYSLNKKFREPKEFNEWKALAWINANIGYIYKTSFGDYRNSLLFYDHCRLIFENNLHTEDFKYSRYYYQVIGNIYTRLGDYKKALYFLKKYKKLAEKANKKELVVKSLNNISIVYKSQGENDIAINTLKKALLIKKVSSKNKINTYINLSEIYLLEKKYNRALISINKALSLIDTNNKSNTKALKAYSLIILSEINFSLGNIEKAKRIIKKAISILTKVYNNPRRREISKLYIKLAKYNLKNKNYIKALENNQYALNLILNDFEYKDFFTNPKKSLLYPENTIAEALQGKAKAFEKLYTLNGNIKYLKKAIESYERILHVWQKLRATYDYEASKLFVLAENKNLLEKAIQISLETWHKTQDKKYFDLAFHFNEQSKNMLLLEAFNKNKASNIIKIPDSLVNKEYDIDIKIAWKKKQKGK